MDSNVKKKKGRPRGRDPNAMCPARKISMYYRADQEEEIRRKIKIVRDAKGDSTDSAMLRRLLQEEYERILDLKERERRLLETSSQTAAGNMKSKKRKDA